MPGVNILLFAVIVSHRLYTKYWFPIFTPFIISAGVALYQHQMYPLVWGVLGTIVMAILLTIYVIKKD
ncbi:hypothetical protein CL630_01130 [bacterium]|nr:hypothetical protein [bacterium]